MSPAPSKSAARAVWCGANLFFTFTANLANAPTQAHFALPHTLLPIQTLYIPYHFTYHHTATMASNPALFARISDLAARLDARWLAHCRTRRSLRISSVSVRPASSLAGHEHYGSLYGVTYYNFKVATGEPYRAGPLATEEKLEEWLAKGLLTYCTCDDVVIAFWTSLEKKLKRMLCVWWAFASWSECVMISFLFL
jgi:hypothetical protein